MSAQWYWVTGINPEPWTAGTAFRYGSSKRLGIAKDGKLKAYQEAVADEFVYQNPHFIPMIGELSLTFFFWRSSAHGNVADATNLQKSTEDALQNILYGNDRNNRHASSTVMEQTPQTAPHILILIAPWERPEIEVPAGVIIPKYANIDWKPPDDELF
jgi:hypothetical protein